MLKIIARYLKAQIQIAHSEEATLKFRSEAARVRAEINESWGHTEYAPHESAHEEQKSRTTAIQSSSDDKRLEILKENFREQFRAAVMDTAAGIASIKTTELRELARNVAYSRYLANSLPDQKYFVQQVLGPTSSAITLQ